MGGVQQQCLLLSSSRLRMSEIYYSKSMKPPKTGVQHKELASIPERTLVDSGKLFVLVLAFDKVLEINEIRYENSERNRLKQIAKDLENKPACNQKD